MLLKEKCIVVSGASGSGKTTIINNFLKKYKTNAELVIYDITREKRTDEKQGVDYNFITKSKFEDNKINGRYAFYYDLLETSRGVLKTTLNELKKNNKVPIIIADYDNLDKIKNIYDVVDIVITTKTKDILIERLKKREKNNEILNHRINTLDSFLNTKQWYKYIIINDKIDVATDGFYKIFTKEFKS